MTHPEREIRFLKAAQTGSQAGITAYYKFAYEKIVRRIITQFNGQLDDQLIVSTFNTSFIMVVESYITSGFCQLVGQRIEGLTSRSFVNVIRKTCVRRLYRLTSRNKNKATESEQTFLEILSNKKYLSEEEYAHFRACAYQALRQLRPFCQDAIRKQRLDGVSYEEMTVFFNSPVGSLRVRVKRCMDQLRVEVRKLVNVSNK